MSGQPSAPTMIVEWLPGVSPTTPNLASAWLGSWSTLSNVEGKCRLLAYSLRRGRDDVLDGYPAGTLTLTLNNSDGKLDEDVSTSDVYGYGAGTPIRFRMIDPATGTTHTRFAGFLQSGWKNVSPQRSRDRIVQIDVWDWLGWAASKKGPSSPIVYEALWNIKAAINAGNGAFWWRGPLSSFPAGVAAPVPSRMWDYSGQGLHGFAADAPFGSGALSVENPPLASTTPLPRCVHFAGATMVTPSSLPTSDATWHAMVLFASVGSASVGRHLLRSSNGVGTTMWSFGINSAGDLFAEVNSAAGTNVGLLVVTGPFDDEQPHWVIFQCANANGGAVSIITDRGISSGTLSGTPAGSGGTIETGAATFAEDPIALSEVQYAGRARLRFVTAPFDTDGDDVGIHSTSFASAISRLPTALNTPPIVQHAGAPSISLPSWVPADNYAATVQALAQSVGGVAFMLADGRLYMRGSHDYVPTSSYSMTGDEYNVKARLTDEDSPPPFSAGTTPPTIRYVSQGRSAKTVDRVVNGVNAQLAHWVDVDSINRYGEHDIDYPGATTTWAAYATAEDWASQIIAKRKDPSSEIAEVEIHPWGDPETTTFALRDLELETKVMYGERNTLGNVIVDDLPVHVQGINEDWTDGSDWRVVLRLAEPIPAEA